MWERYAIRPDVSGFVAENGKRWIQVEPHLFAGQTGGKDGAALACARRGGLDAACKKTTGVCVTEIDAWAVFVLG